jgi:hypothetical protein
MEKFKGGPDPEFDMSEVYVEVTREGHRPKEAINRSIMHHVSLLRHACEDFWDALDLVNEIDGDVTYRVRQYAKCIAKTTENYKSWLKDEYVRKLKSELRLAYADDE